MMDNGWYRLCVYSMLGIFLIRYSSAIYTYRMEEYCGNGSSSHSARDQVRVTLQLQRHQASCEMTLTSRDDYLMFYVERINLPCRTGYLTLRYGVTMLDALDRICEDTSIKEDVYTTKASYLTILYTSKNLQDDEGAFSLIITSFHTGNCSETRHKCDNGRCISKALTCNGFKSCGDGSSCLAWFKSILKVAIPVIVLLAVAGCVYYFCRKVIGKNLNCNFEPTRDQTQIPNAGFIPPTWHQTQIPNAGFIPPTWHQTQIPNAGFIPPTWHQTQIPNAGFIPPTWPQTQIRNDGSMSPTRHQTQIRNDGSMSPTRHQTQLQQSSTVIAIPAVTEYTSSTETLAETGDTVDTETLAVTGDTSSTEDLAETGDTVDTESIDTEEFAETGDTVDTDD